MTSKLLSPALLLVLPLGLLACSGDKGGDTGAAAAESDADADADTDADTDADADADADADTTLPPDLYAFASAFDGSASVAYSGQVMRHVLIDDMKAHLGGITDRLNDAYYPAPGDVAAELDFYFSFDSSVGGGVDLLVSTELPALQQTYDDVSTDKDLVGKLAGNDPVGQRRDWTLGMDGWAADGTVTPESLVRDWFATIDAQAQDWVSGDYPRAPDGSPVPAVYVTPEGHDLQQLLEKFLRGAVAYSQAADDYLDDDEPGKGLLADHTAAVEGKGYTELEHQWDEGFGYFGASRSFGARTPAEIDASPDADLDQDGMIDLLRERDFGHSRNAGKRDLGATVATAFAAEAWTGFYEGRVLLAETAGTALSESQLATLQGHRDQALAAWEKAIAASVVHYINEVLVDMSTLDDPDYDFGAHAKHWSEMKGFALSLQFNPRSPMSPELFVELHNLLGQAPVLPGATADRQAGAVEDLLDARTVLGDVYGFNSDNLGGTDGLGGW